MNDILSQIKQFSVIVADTGDFESIRKYQPRDTTTNPSLLLKAAQMPEYAAVVERALADARQESPDPGQTLGLALDIAVVRRSTLEDVFLRLTGRALIEP